MKEHPDKTRREAQDEILKERVANRRWLDDDFWFTNPFPKVAEPEMEAAYITEVERLGEKHLSRLFGTVSLLGVNIFFANLRRKQSMLERPISTPSAAGRKRCGYSAYNPRILTKIVAIHKVWFNYARRNLKQNITPAMRLGLAEKPIEPHRILYGLLLAEGRTKTFYHWERKERNQTLGAFRTHGILKKMLKKKPNLAKIEEQIVRHVTGKHLIIFNAPFDYRYLAPARVSVATPAHQPACRTTAREPERVFLDVETTGKDTTHDQIIHILKKAQRARQHRARRRPR
jgi:DNA polymerase III epsilon subunit-like protein